MKHLAIIVMLLLGGCANDPAHKNGNNSNNNTINQTTATNILNCNNVFFECPDGYVEDSCDLQTEDCIQVGDATCGIRCLSTLGGCQNNTFSGTCEAGYYIADMCLTPGCVVSPGCSPDYDTSCEPYATIDPATWSERTRIPDATNPLTSCTFDEDCVMVPGGDVCGCLDCPRESVHHDDEAAYRGDLDAARDLCDSLVPCGDAPCQQFVPHCDLQTSLCEGREAKYVTIEGLPTLCEVAADCIAVFEGEVCDACMCPNAAIPASLADTYAEAFDVDCEHNVDCDCAAVEVDCVEGSCELLTP